MAKRYRQIRAKPGQIKIAYGRPDPGEPADLVYAWGNRVAKPNAYFLMSALSAPRTRLRIDGRLEFEKSIIDELVERGFDLKTMKMVISKKIDSGDG